MIGNFSFEEHDRYFTRMYNHLRFIDRSLDITTIINIIKCKVILEQEQENIMHNLNIKNISNTPMIKDFKIWFSKYDLQSEDEESEAQSEDEESEEENEEEDEYNEEEIDSEDGNKYINIDFQSDTQSEDEESEAQNSEDENDYSGVDEFRRHYRNNEVPKTQVHSKHFNDHSRRLLIK